MLGRVVLFIMLVSSVILAPLAHGYVFSRTAAGVAVRWPSPYKPTFYVNWNNNDLLSYSNVFDIFTTSLQRWKNTGSTAIDFDYYQGGSYPVTWGYDGKNAIFFQSESSDKLGASTLGVTYVFSSGGVIVETDIEFNDESFNFTTNPSDSSQFGAGTNVYLSNVATHEFGHAYGLNHSAALQSSMVYTETRGQAKPSCDDIQAIGNAYPSAAFSAGRGSITGTVADTNPVNVFGAHVLAVSRTRGTVVAGAITDTLGAFTIPDLEPGDYYLMVEPFQSTSPIASLCGGVAAGCYYGTVNSHTRCGGGTTPFIRKFIETGVTSGDLQTHTVTSGLATNAGAIQVDCVALADPRPGGTPSTSTANAQTLTNLSNNAGAEATAAVWGLIPTTGNSNYFILSNVTGNIKATVLSYGLYSEFDPQVLILDNPAGTVNGSAAHVSNTFSNSSSFINYDSTATLNGASGNYYIQVKNSSDLSTNSSLYPAGHVSGQIDSAAYYILIVTINDSTTLLPSTANPLLANNARCEATDSFSAFPDHGPGAGNAVTSGVSNTGEAKAGCGVIRRSDGEGGTPLGPSALFTGWGVLFMLLLGRILQRLGHRMMRRPLT